MNITKEITPMPDPMFPINIFIQRPPSCIPMNWHDHLELIYVISGNATMSIDKKLFQVEAGDLLFINSKEIHASWDESDDTQMVAIVFNDALIRNNRIDCTEHRYILPILDREIDIPTLLNHENPYLNEIRLSLEKLLMEFFLKDFGYELIVKSELFRIVTLILRFIQEQIRKKYSIQTSENDEQLKELLKYLQSNLAEHLTVDDAAKKMNLSPSHFCRVFKRKVGMTLIQYINLLRVQQAEKLLGDSLLPISVIAHQVGYSSITHFERVFRKYKNVSPSEFRIYKRDSDHTMPASSLFSIDRTCP
ncbi:MAG: AraC family transcriptional regulator [Alicyclobacillus sp.]|nr:AraC family transcriptional regulator [Alicyclobacillus sp.]